MTKKELGVALEFDFYSIKKLQYRSDQIEHKCYIDAINANPANCRYCGRLMPKELYDRSNGYCGACFWYVRDKAAGFKPDFPYDYDDEIKKFRQECPEMFQKVRR